MLYIITNPRTAPEVCSSSKGPGMKKKGSEVQKKDAFSRDKRLQNMFSFRRKNNEVVNHCL